MAGKKSGTGPPTVKDDRIGISTGPHAMVTRDKNIDNNADTEQDERINNSSSRDDLVQREWNDMINSDTRT